MPAPEAPVKIFNCFITCHFRCSCENIMMLIYLAKSGPVLKNETSFATVVLRITTTI